jgi:hypothetical protein
MNKDLAIIIISNFLKKYILYKKYKNETFNYKILYQFLDKYIEYNKFIDQLNLLLNYKKIRHNNFPSEISENIVKYIIYKKYNIMPILDSLSTGDLILKFNNKYIQNKKIEIKTFSSIGPISFGPTESSDWIYFVDCTEYNKYIFKIYELKISNKDTIWLNILINKQQTFFDQIKQKRRPRIKFNNLYKQLSNLKLIYNNSIKNL